MRLLRLEEKTQIYIAYNLTTASLMDFLLFRISYSGLRTHN